MDAMEKEISRRIKQAIEEKLFPGCVVGVVNKDGSRLTIPVGKHTYGFLSPVMGKDSVFDVASITKVVLAMVTLAMVECGTLSLDDAVVSYLPEFDTEPAKRLVSIRHLLSYTLDLVLPPLSSLKDETSEEIVRRVCTASLAHQPGSVYRYSNADALLLSLCLMISNEEYPMGRAAHLFFFNRLDMCDASFNVLLRGLERVKQRVVPTQYCTWRRRELYGKVHDEITYTLQQSYGTRAIGIAGLFSSAQDLLTLLEMILHNGKFRGQRYLTEETVTQMFTKQFPNVPGCGGLGWNLYPQEYMGQYGTPQTFGKTGFTGCMVMGDRSKGKALVILSNSHYPKRKVDLMPQTRFRSDIADIVFRD